MNRFSPKNATRFFISSSSGGDGAAKCYEETGITLHFGEEKTKVVREEKVEDMPHLRHLYGNYEKFNAVSRSALVYTLRCWSYPHLEWVNCPTTKKNESVTVLGEIYDEGDDWDVAYKSMLVHEELSEYCVGYEKCGHVYHTIKGHWKEDEVRNICADKAVKVAHYDKGCMICAKYFIQKQPHRRHLAILMRMAGVHTELDETGNEIGQVDPLPYSEMRIKALRLFYKFLYFDRNVLTFEEWKALRDGDATRDDIAFGRHCSTHHLFWPNFDKEKNSSTN
jgi:hypothetical protein